MTRRPVVRECGDEEEADRPSAWMIQSAQPQEYAEDPFGMQRPTDRDDHTAAEEFASSLSERWQARLVSTPGDSKWLCYRKIRPTGGPSGPSQTLQRSHWEMDIVLLIDVSGLTDAVA